MTTTVCVYVPVFAGKKCNARLRHSLTWQINGMIMEIRTANGRESHDERNARAPRPHKHQTDFERKVFREKKNGQCCTWFSCASAALWRERVATISERNRKQNYFFFWQTFRHSGLVCANSFWSLAHSIFEVFDRWLSCSRRRSHSKTILVRIVWWHSFPIEMHQRNAKCAIRIDINKCVLVCVCVCMCSGWQCIANSTLCKLTSTSSCTFFTFLSVFALCIASDAWHLIRQSQLIHLALEQIIKAVRSAASEIDLRQQPTPIQMKE